MSRIQTCFFSNIVWRAFLSGFTSSAQLFSTEKSKRRVYYPPTKYSYGELRTRQMVREQDTKRVVAANPAYTSADGNTVRNKCWVTPASC